MSVPDIVYNVSAITPAVDHVQQQRELINGIADCLLPWVTCDEGRAAH